MVSQGTPMILGGDEFRRTQLGNNNAYCQDNKISWFNWDMLHEHEEIYRFFRGMVQFRKNHPVLRRNRHFTGEIDPTTGFRDIEWHGVRLGKSDFDYHSHSLSFIVSGLGIDHSFFVVINTYWEGLNFELPALPAGWLWVQVVNTSLEAPDDFYEPGHEKPIHPSEKYVHAGARSVIILMSNHGG